MTSQSLQGPDPKDVPQPYIFRNVVRRIPGEVREWANEEFRAHREEWGFEEVLNIAGCLNGCDVAVGTHTDFDFSRDEVLWGLVIESEGHVFHWNGRPVGMLSPGDVYVLDPSVPHGTWVQGMYSTYSEAKLLLGIINLPASRYTTPAEAAGMIIHNLRDAMVRHDRGPQRWIKHYFAKRYRPRRMISLLTSEPPPMATRLCRGCAEEWELDDERHDRDCPIFLMDGPVDGPVQPVATQIA